MSILEKQKKVNELTEMITNKRFVLIGENKGLKVSHMDALRRQGREKEVVVKVMKNSLSQRALSSLNNAESFLVGQNVIALSDDELTATKLFQDFITQTKLIDFKVAYIDRKVVDVTGLKELAKIDSKELLFARVAYVIKLICEKK